MTTKINATTSGLIETVDTSGVLEFQTANSSALVIGTDQNANFTGTTAITVPNGTTAQRPTPVNGMMRYNTTLSIFEVYANNTWSAANVTPTPVNTVAPVISGSAIVGQNLTCTTGTWSGSPSAYYYQWLANATAISGQTANVLTLTLTENGANITCNVTAYNVAGNSSPATSNSLGPVIQGVSATYLVVAGGGGSGGAAPNYVASGGGGAGGLLTGTTILQPANTYSITIGAGGAGGAAGFTNGNNGGNSSFSAIANVAVGGALGQGYNQSGATGGSGGGGANNNQAGSAGTSGQGYAGGNGGVYSNSNATQGAGGGGGSSQVGFNFSGTGSGGSNNGGAGGNGTSSSISGVATYYAGGGGGGAATGTGGAGGLGGGGAGNSGWAATGSGTPGSASTGGGGGGSSTQLSNSYAGASGGSGIVIISYAGAQQFGGGVISTDGSNTIHTFYTSGSLVPLTALNSSYIIVGGGGGGGAVCGGGGGGGGFYSGSNVTIDANSTYTIVVGAGGTAGPTAASSFGGAGGNSTFSMTSNVAIGGGYGGGGFYSVAAYNGGNGASGGGGGGYWSMGQTSGGTGTAGQGFNGGNALNGTGYPGGGGGGFSSAGANATASQGGNGGNGVSSSISGTLTYYAGGGGGGTSAGSAGAAGLGGAAGSGSGAGSSASAGTGGGGGGGNQSSAGGAGGSGTVIISYPGSTPMMAGGNVTVVSNTVVHTFTSSGYLTPFVNFNNSLRFRSSASAYLSRTPSVTGDRQKFTISTWVKRGVLSSGNPGLFGTYDGGSFQFYFATDSLGIYSQSAGIALYTNQVFRDPAAWYHFVLAVDTTQATASDRVKLYVNGTQVTSFSSATYPSQNANCEWNRSGQLAVIGAIQNNSGGSIFNYFDGYQTEINNVSGQALGPNYFGAYDQYGTWKPIRYAGSYGLTGFYLNFGNTANTTALGYDSSGNQNNWSTNNFSLTAGATYDAMVDVPTLTSANVSNYCVMNPLSYYGASSPTYSDGNLKVQTLTSTTTLAFGSMAFPYTGKWYFEFSPLASSNSENAFYCGIASYDISGSCVYYNSGSSGQVYVNGSYNGQSGAAYTIGDWIGVAVDSDAGTVKFYKNGSLQVTVTFSVTSKDFFAAMADGSSSSNATYAINFGQQPWNYAPPAGYVALNTYNL